MSVFRWEGRRGPEDASDGAATKGMAMMHAADDLGVGVNNRQTRLPENGKPLPEGLRWAIETLSGYDMSDVRVYYASNVPARVGARALARGTDIHVQSGAEDALPHEAWHVVQQMQGRVAELADVNGMSVNDDPALEKEADTMGAMAAALSFAGMWQRAKGALAKVRIKKPVVQPQYVVVDKVRYEAIAKPDAGVKDIQQLLKDIGANVKLTSMPESNFQRIVTDLIAQNCEFSTWNALAKEFEIRFVGDAVVTTLRAMLKSNMEKDEIYEDAKKTMRQLEEDLQALMEDASSGTKDKELQEIKKQVEKAKVDAQALDDIILRWSSNSFPNYSHRSKQMMEWWLDLRKDEPRLSNCWECALLALVKTRFLKVPKGYMIWCVEQIETSLYVDFAGTAPQKVQLSRLYTSAVRNMDYYFPRYGVPVIDANKERFRPLKDTKSCFDLPVDFIIPRGRLLIFDYLGHVAISTGEMIPIKTQAGQEAWGRKMGHGVIDLNAVGETLRERTIEDFARAGNCNNQLIVAPFPICTDSKTITMKGTVPPTKEEVEAYRRTLDTEATEKYDRLVKELEETRDLALKKAPAKKTQIEKNHKSKVSELKAKFETAVVEAGKLLDKRVKQLRDVTPEPEEENLKLSYGPVDPYGGKVTF